jgi:hypothetical protein
VPFNARHITVTALFFVLIAGGRAWGGAPFVTDDPDALEYKHWEIDLFSTYSHTGGANSAQVPALELDYGLFTDVTLHAIAPLTLDQVPGGSVHYGYGDTELGVQWRFFHETGYLPEIGFYPLVEVPTGNSGRGLGNGQTQVFLPIWFQKSFGKDKEWTTFGGGGFWYNPGVDQKNFFQVGWALQRDFNEHLTLGGEIYHESAAADDENGHTAFNLGGYLNFDEHNHFLFSAGRDIEGPNRFSCYVGYQLTF